MQECVILRVWTGAVWFDGARRKLAAEIIQFDFNEPLLRPDKIWGLATRGRKNILANAIIGPREPAVLPWLPFVMVENKLPSLPLLLPPPLTQPWMLCLLIAITNWHNLHRARFLYILFPPLFSYTSFSFFIHSFWKRAFKHAWGDTRIAGTQRRRRSVAGACVYVGARARVPPDLPYLK